MKKEINKELEDTCIKVYSESQGRDIIKYYAENGFNKIIYSYKTDILNLKFSDIFIIAVINKPSIFGLDPQLALNEGGIYFSSSRNWKKEISLPKNNLPKMYNDKFKILKTKNHMNGIDFEKNLVKFLDSIVYNENITVEWCLGTCMYLVTNHNYKNFFDSLNLYRKETDIFNGHFKFIYTDSLDDVIIVSTGKDPEKNDSIIGIIDLCE